VTINCATIISMFESSLHYSLYFISSRLSYISNDHLFDNLRYWILGSTPVKTMTEALE
ncbi:hypothetical protein RYX36_035409, partial [Vicia faba]